MTASKNITFLLDDGRDVVAALGRVFGRPNSVRNRLTALLAAKPAFLFVTASMKPNRLFGDPYTGQVACFSKLFAYDHRDRKRRSVIVYAPLQSFGIFPHAAADWRRSKGLRLFEKLVDVIICEGGVCVLPASQEIL